MIPTILRVELVILAMFFIFIVGRNVNRKKLMLQYSIIWIAISVSMIIVAIFPGIAVWFTDIVGIQEPVNMVNTAGLFVLIFVSFGFTEKLSKQSVRIRNLIQQEAIDRYLMEQRGEK